MSGVYRAQFSSGFTANCKDLRRVMTHAWHSTGYHRLSNKPWSFHGFSGTRWQAERRMDLLTRFAMPDRISFAEVVEVDLISVEGRKAYLKERAVLPTPLDLYRGNGELG